MIRAPVLSGLSCRPFCIGLGTTVWRGR